MITFIKAEECERQNREMEMRIEDLKEKTKEAEDLTDHQTEQEDKYDERLRRMHEELKVYSLFFQTTDYNLSTKGRRRPS